MSKKLKFLAVSFLALALVVGVGASSANATLTLEALTITSSGVLTLDGAAASAITVGSATTTGNIAIGGVLTTGTLTLGKTTQTGITVISGSTSGANTLFNNVAGGSISIGTVATGAINIGAGSAVHAITIGSVDGASSVAYKAGTGKHIFTGVINATSPVFVTPELGAATATSVNGLVVTSTLGTLTIPNNTSAALILSGNFGTTLTSTATTNATLPAGTNTLYSTLADSITSAALLSSVSDETGTGLAVFATSPTLTTPVLGAATGISLQLSGLTASEMLGTDASKNIVSLAVATYPSLTEFAFVKGVTSALQTQLDLKAPLASPTFTGTMTLANGETIANSTDGIITMTGQVLVNPTRVADAYAYGFNISSGDLFFTGGAAQKSYLLNISGNRPVASAATGDSNDSGIKVSLNNYAANDSNFIIRGLNTGINNRSGGTLGILEGASIGAQNKSGGTSPTVRGLTVTPENYGTTATEFGGIDVVLKNEGAQATTSYGMRVRSTEASSMAAIGAGYLLSNTSTNGFSYGLDMNGATIGTADIRLNGGTTITDTAGVMTLGATTINFVGNLQIPSGAGLANAACASLPGRIYLATTTANSMTADKVYVCNTAGDTWLLMN